MATLDNILELVSEIKTDLAGVQARQIRIIARLNENDSIADEQYTDIVTQLGSMRKEASSVHKRTVDQIIELRRLIKTGSTTDPDILASERVLHTTELLEHILSYLPMQHLLFAQGISKHFQSVIRDFIKLHRALFKVPDLNHEAGDGDVKVNPLFHSMWTYSGACVYLVFRNDEGHFNVLPGRKPHNAVPHEKAPLRYVSAAALRISMTIEKDSELLSLVRDGSWGDMFITQPPVPLRVHTIFRRCRNHFLMRAMDGELTASQVMDAVQTTAKQSPQRLVRGRKKKVIASA